MEIEIKSAKVKSDLFLAYSYTQKEEHRVNNHDTKSDAPIHPDLRHAFNNLVPHLILLAGQTMKEDAVSILSNESETTEEMLENYKVTAFTIGGSGESEGVTITGYKILANGKKINLNTPFTKFHDDNDSYAYDSELIKTIEDLKEEVLAYMSGKQAESNQTAMDFDEFAPDDEFEADRSEDDQGEVQEFIPSENVA